MEEMQETRVVKIHRSGTSPGGEHGNPLQYSCLENPMDRGSWWATVHEVTKSPTRLSNRARACARTHTHTHKYLFKPLYCDIVLMQVKQHSAKMTLAMKSLQSAGRGGQTANSMQCNQCWVEGAYVCAEEGHISSLVSVVRENVFRGNELSSGERVDIRNS